jgi:hypothetical protein
MSLWLVQALVISTFGIITLALLGNKLDEGDDSTTTYNEVFIPIYIGIGLYVIYVVANAIGACAGCGRRRRLKRSLNSDDDDDDDDDTITPSPAFNSRRRAAAALTNHVGGEFSNAGEIESRPEEDVAEQAKAAAAERSVIIVDTVIDLLFAGVLLATFIVLGITLDKSLVDENFTAFFVLFYIALGLYVLLLAVGTINTYIIDSSPAGLASGKATLCAGVLCCCSNMDAELYAEADASVDGNLHTSRARKDRYMQRAEFQDRTCVYACAPYAAPGWIQWLLALFLWLVPFAILVSAILLQVYLNRAVANEQLLTTTTTLVPTVAPLSLDSIVRVFKGRVHHAATFAPRIDTVTLAAEVLAHAPATDPSGSTNNIDFGIVLLPIFVALGVLILNSFCLCVSCIAVGRTIMEWALGSIYIVWLAFFLWFFVELAERVDFGPRADGLEGDSGEDFQDLFVPLYIAFGLTLVIGACGFICLPASYRPQRAYVSKWGVVVYKS